MTDVQVRVYNSSGSSLIAILPNRKGVRWQDELNTPGVGSFTIHLDDPMLVSHPNLLDDFNIVKVYVGGAPVKAWIIESKQRTNLGQGDNAARWVEVSGRGVLALLGNAVVYPEYATLRRTSADERSFDYGSKTGGWYVSSDWVTPVGVRQDASTTRKGYPYHWPDKAAQWLWSSSPDSNSAPGYNWFRGTFTLTSPARVTIYAAGDNNLDLQLDGEPIIHSGNRWHYTSSWTGDLASGSHLIAAAVGNFASATGGNSPAGFLCSVAIVDRANRIQQIRMRSAPATFKVRSYGSPPGWFSASILKTLVDEAKARGVQGLSGVTYGFTDTADSASATWTSRQDRSFEIGTRDLLDVAAQLSETDFDLDMTGSLVLNAWKQRGTDRRATITLSPGSLLSADASSNAAQVKGRALVRHGNGWVEVSDSTSESTYGRREAGLMAGGSSSDSQATTLARSALNDIGKPEVTVPIVSTSAMGTQPFTAAGGSFDVGDIVTAPGLLGTLAPHRVMAISAEEDDVTGVLTYTSELYPE